MVQIKAIWLLLLLYGASPALLLASTQVVNAPNDITSREAFEAARQLNTPAAWNAFLASFPNGFSSDLARAYLGKLQQDGAGSYPLLKESDLA